jgi:hypothetical protein
MSQTKKALLTAGLLCLASLGLYAPTLTFGFLRFDDHAILLAHPRLYNQGSLLASLREIFLNYFPREEPLLIRDLSWAIDSRLFGQRNPLGYHATNVVLNALNVALLYILLLQVTRHGRLALVAAGLFAVLPVHVEAVCWVMGRKDVLSAFFVLLCLNCEARALATASSPVRRWWRLAALALCPLAILAKLSAVTLVGVLAILRLSWPHLAVGVPRAVCSRRKRAYDLMGLLPHAVVSVGLFVWYSHVLHRFGMLDSRGPSPLSAEHLGHLAWFTPLVVGEYLRLTFWPTEMSIWYTWPHVAIPLTAREQAVAVVLAVALVSWTVWLWLCRREWFAYWAIFLVLLSPYLNLTYIGIWVASRYLYLSAFCLLMIATRAGMTVWERWGPRLRDRRWLALLGWGALATVGVHGLASTLAYAQVFRDNESLWTYEVTREDSSVLAHQALAREYCRQAEAMPAGPERQAAIMRAAVAVERAIARYQSIPWIDKPNYLVPEIGYQSNLLVMRGQLQGMQGQPLAVQLQTLRAAHAIGRTLISTSLLAQTLSQMAQQTGRIELANESLQVYLQLAVMVSPDKALHEETRVALGNHAQRFPQHEPQVRAIEEKYLR